jgi:hypothetical protein
MSMSQLAITTTTAPAVIDHGHSHGFHMALTMVIGNATTDIDRMKTSVVFANLPGIFHTVRLLRTAE